ncbi:MAG: ParB/RepB/Spo0J family partition protein [Planctomycetaceae bacterium]|nr:ParB/RepB/Spo0J family partition protein [Planctomycetaceae bacterium]
MDEQQTQDFQPEPNYSPEDQIPEVVPRRRLGRGLEALLGGGGPANEPHGHEGGDTPRETEAAGWNEIAIDRIQRNPLQPRKIFDKESLDELAASVRKHGVLQPVIVREYGENYELIAGERRWLAAKQAGLSTVPCRVVDVIDKTAIEFAFEENMKRKDLSDLEKAQAFHDYIEVFESSIEELARQLSMSRSAVSNTIRLLELPVPVKNALQENKLNAGHARALLALKEESQQLELAQRIQREQLNVRKTEQIVKEMQGREVAIPVDKPLLQPRVELSNHLLSLQDQLRSAIGVKVEFKLKTQDSGQVLLHFQNQHDFDRILEALQNSSQSRAA